MNFRHLAAAGVSLISLSTQVFAQDKASEEKDSKDTIVVTGTLIRGTEVAGSQTIAVDSASIIQQGALSTNQMLGMIPQIANAFNGRFEQDSRGVKAITINRPNLRNLPNLTSASGSATLVMVDGYRITPVGVKESGIDVDIIPAMALEGVDVVTEGGSSLYGADAVSGVINFRTRRKYDGIKIDGNFGQSTTIKGFTQWDGSILAGKSWATGNAWITAGYSSRDNIRANETSWLNGLRYNTDGTTKFTGSQCPTPVGTELRWKHFNSGVGSWTNNPLASGAGLFAVGAACDIESLRNYVPKQTRINVYGALSQEVADNIDLRVTAYYTKRVTSFYDAPLGYTSVASPFSIPAGSPGAQSGAAFGAAIGGDPAINTIIAVPGGTGFAFSANSAYVDRPHQNSFETWGVSPELTFKIGGDWQLRTAVHFGHSLNKQRWNEVYNALAQCYITGCTAATSPTGSAVTAGQLNPQNPSAAAGSVVTDILNYETQMDTIQEMFNFRAVADGSLFQLPGGAAKLAIGVEYNNPSAKVRLTTDRRGAVNSLPYMRNDRNSKSVFAEVNLPIASFADVNGSVRYDKYSDFGDTTNPSLGLTLKPVDGFKIFGHWNTSFNAPTTLDQLPLALGRQGGIIYNNAVDGSGNFTNGPTDPLKKWNGTGTKSLVLEGPGFGIKPQTAHSWAIGFEAKPLDGLRFGGEFYNIDFKNVIGGVDVTATSSYVNFPQYFHFQSNTADGTQITPALYNSLVSQMGNASFITANLPIDQIAVIVDRRTSNLNSAKLQGYDFHVYYDTDVSFGKVHLGLAGTKQTKATLSTKGFADVDNLGLNFPELNAYAFAGVDVGGFTGKVTVYYSGKFHDGTPDYLGNQVIVNSVTTVSTFLGYDFGEDAGALSGTSIRLTVDNLFNRTPQYIKRAATSSAPTYATFSLGRVIKVGFSKEF